MNRWFSKPLHFFILAVVLVWLKSYIAYLTEFQLGVSNAIQTFLLFLNPLSSAMLFLGLALFSRKSSRWIMALSAIMTIVLYSNILYYRFFNDFVTLPTLFQTSNAGHMGGSIIDLMEWHDAFYFLDLLVLFIVLWMKKQNWKGQFTTKRKAGAILIAGGAVFFLNLGLAETDRPQLLSRAFDRTYLVKYLGAYNYAIYDAVQTVQNEKQSAFASSDDLANVENFTKSHYAKPNSLYFGKAEGMNVIKIHLESFQTFLIDYKLHGEEVTPFLNSLAHNDQYMYFDNFFHQTGQGKTADAELMMDTSLYGLPQGAAFVLKGRNTYQAAPAILNQKAGYTSAVLHGDYKTFWNRNEVYKQMGIDTFFDASYYNMEGDRKINYGLKDKPFFEESLPMLQSLPQPFYAHLMTLTHHFPYLIDEKDATIAPAETGDATVDRYFQTARYMDEALEAFFAELKAAGLYDNSMILIYGDHYGISENHNEAMEQVLGQEITDFDSAHLQRVPLMIHVPGVKGGVQHQYGGEIDVMPTMLHLLGIETNELIQFGTDLLSEEHDELVVFRNGDYVTPNYTSVSGTYYSTKTGEVLEATPEMQALKQKAAEQLSFSDQVLYGDLLRFHTVEGLTPVDPSKYSYGKPETEE